MDEHQILDKIKHLVDLQNRGSLPFGDDAVAIQMSDGFLVINIDGWVASTDRPTGLSAFACGYRAVINALSDVIAKGAKPTDVVISLSTPDMSEVEELVRGFSKAAEDYGVHYLGGDLNQANDTVIDVTAIGMTDKLISRQGAKEGELLYWMGPQLGQTAAALGILVKNWKGDQNKALEIMGEPKLFPEFIDLLKIIKISSSIDCSDGLIKSIYQLVGDRVGVDLIEWDRWKIDVWAKEVAEENGKAIKDLVFYGGEELGILFTCDEADLEDNVQILGRITEEKNVRINGKVIENRGWEHFSDRK